MGWDIFIQAFPEDIRPAVTDAQAAALVGLPAIGASAQVVGIGEISLTVEDGSVTVCSISGATWSQRLVKFLVALMQLGPYVIVGTGLPIMAGDERTAAAVPAELRQEAPVLVVPTVADFLAAIVRAGVVSEAQALSLPSGDPRQGMQTVIVRSKDRFALTAARGAALRLGADDVSAIKDPQSATRAIEAWMQDKPEEMKAGARQFLAEAPFENHHFTVNWRSFEGDPEMGARVRLVSEALAGRPVEVDAGLCLKFPNGRMTVYGNAAAALTAAAAGSQGGIGLVHEPIPANASRLAEQFVAAAAKVDGVKLDYSVGSIALLERILDRFRETGTDPNRIGETLFCAGVYLGEVMARNAGCAWVVTPAEHRAMFPGPMLLQVPGGVCDPIGKAFKRAADPQESLRYFYQIFTSPPPPAGLAGANEPPRAPEGAVKALGTAALTAAAISGAAALSELIRTGTGLTVLGIDRAYVDGVPLMAVAAALAATAGLAMNRRGAAELRWLQVAGAALGGYAIYVQIAWSTLRFDPGILLAYAAAAYIWWLAGRMRAALIRSA
jgi:hypothetical protein